MGIQDIGPVKGTPVGGGFTDVAVVIAGTVMSTGLTVLNDLLKGTINMRPIIGGFIVGTALLVIAMFNTPIAVALALLMLVTSVLINGTPILEKVMNYS